jgi:hypothetical protein
MALREPIICGAEMKIAGVILFAGFMFVMGYWCGGEKAEHNIYMACADKHSWDRHWSLLGGGVTFSCVKTGNLP